MARKLTPQEKRLRAIEREKNKIKKYFPNKNNVDLNRMATKEYEARENFRKTHTKKELNSMDARIREHNQRALSLESNPSYDVQYVSYRGMEQAKTIYSTSTTKYFSERGMVKNKITATQRQQNIERIMNRSYNLDAFDQFKNDSDFRKYLEQKSASWDVVTWAKLFEDIEPSEDARGMRIEEDKALTRALGLSII